MRVGLLLCGILVLSIPTACAADQKDIQALLSREIIGPRQTMVDVQEYLDKRIPRMPPVKTLAEWEQHAQQIRQAVLDRVVFRGEAASWRDAKINVQWLETIKGGPGYRIKKLRYEAAPGLWVPALLYEPAKLTGKVPVSLAVNGHEGIGKAVPYKQIRCINMAKRGMLVLNVEWLGMGQLRSDGYHHGRMNQLDLCGTSGLAPFYLSMKRGLDVLLALEHADPQRVIVSGLSGGGWQTIFISSLDTRVTLANPVAGYSSFRTRLRHFKDLGDSEQTPCDLATIADYTHLTALMAPRATLLTYNSKDECCFESGYALPPLVEAAAPVIKLYGKNRALRTHVNDDPGTHNFEKDNRQALYRMIGDGFYAGDAGFNAQEIPCADEVKSQDDLAVELPKNNANFQSLALTISKNLPRQAELPGDRSAAEKWQRNQRAKLRHTVQVKDHKMIAGKVRTEEKAGVQATFWKLRMDDAWTVPVVELVRGEPKGTAILVNDAGRAADPVNAERLLKEGYRVFAVDPFYFGESRIEKSDWLFALLLASIGDRPLGIQAGQLAAVARWAAGNRQTGPVKLVAVGPRSSTYALIAAALEAKAIVSVELHGALGSLKEIIEGNRTVDPMPEMFCFGLLEAFDVKHLAALVAPRRLQVVAPSDRAKKELADLKSWPAFQGVEWGPF